MTLTADFSLQDTWVLEALGFPDRLLICVILPIFLPKRTFFEKLPNFEKKNVNIGRCKLQYPVKILSLVQKAIILGEKQFKIAQKTVFKSLPIYNAVSARIAQ